MKPPLCSAEASDTALLVVGGSARFLASSCRRAGWTVYAADRFGDSDLLAITAAHRLLPDSLENADDPFPEHRELPFLFTGGCENAPQWLAQLATRRPIAAASPAAVEAVRSLAALAEAATEVGLRIPETHSSPAGLPTDGSYLVKPTSSVGGQRVARWQGGAAPTYPARWQRHCPGIPYGVSLLLLDNQPPQLLGVCRSLRRQTATAAPGWAYAGSVTVTPPPWVERVLALADRLASQHGLRGAIGIDCLATPRGSPTLLEVNPRPTASMELLERTAGLSIARCHLEAFGLSSPGPQPPLTPPQQVSGKAILYARRPLCLTPAVHAALERQGITWARHPGLPALADIPRPHTSIEAGSPVVTVLADADRADAVETLLAERLHHIRALCERVP